MTHDKMMASIAPVFGITASSVSAIADGLINHTYKVSQSDGRSFIVQQINTGIFSSPDHLMQNYGTIFDLLKSHYPLPLVVPTVNGHPYATINSEVWRCFIFIENSYTPTGVITPELAYTTALSFGKYTSLLSEASPALQVILPQFHDLEFRAAQLLEAKKNAIPQRLKAAAPWLNHYDNYTSLIKQYSYWTQHPRYFPLRILHHDAKASNILFDSSSHQVICPIDFDTTQSGLFFSDLGDMIRSMVPSHPENEKDTALLEVRHQMLEAIVQGYQEATHALWTPQEREALPLSGKLLLYMQSMRFLTDYLNNDVYYQTTYEGQNLDRAANQCIILNLLNQVI